MNPRKAELTRKFQSITLPALSDNDNPDTYYSPILDALSVRTKFELKMIGNSGHQGVPRLAGTGVSHFLWWLGGQQ